MDAFKMEKNKFLKANKCETTNYELCDIFQHIDYFSSLSHEVLCHVMDYLPLKYVIKIDCQNKRLQQAVSLHLKTRKSIDFTENKIFGWLPEKLTDTYLTKLLIRCTNLENIHGFHPKQIWKRQIRSLERLTIPGVIEALKLCENLKGIEISEIFVLEAILNYLPTLNILGTFQNRNGNFPVKPTDTITLTQNPHLTSLHLNGIIIPELPPLNFVKHLQLRWVKLTNPSPFKDFSAPKLQTFVMVNCVGPQSALKYVPLITGLAVARLLRRLEFIRVPFLGGLLQHVVEDSSRLCGFRQLQCIKFGACKHAQELDVGFLAITSAQSLEEISIQPSLTRDSLFVSLKLADVSFVFLTSLSLGFVDSFPEPGKWTTKQLVNEGLTDVTESPALITDHGMNAVGQCFLNLCRLELYNCPHIHKPTTWLSQGNNSWSKLKELYIRRCHAVKLEDLCQFIPQLPSRLELLHLEAMFREPPKGCSRVGLSAGTGLGMSSASFLSQHAPQTANQINDIGTANQDAANNNNSHPEPMNDVETDAESTGSDEISDSNNGDENELDNFIDDLHNYINDVESIDLEGNVGKSMDHEANGGESMDLEGNVGKSMDLEGNGGESVYHEGNGGESLDREGNGGEYVYHEGNGGEAVDLDGYGGESIDYKRNEERNVSFSNDIMSNGNECNVNSSNCDTNNSNEDFDQNTQVQNKEGKEMIPNKCDNLVNEQNTSGSSIDYLNMPCDAPILIVWSHDKSKHSGDHKSHDFPECTNHSVTTSPDIAKTKENNSAERIQESEVQKNSYNRVLVEEKYETGNDEKNKQTREREETPYYNQKSPMSIDSSDRKMDCDNDNYTYLIKPSTSQCEQKLNNPDSHIDSKDLNIISNPSRSISENYSNVCESTAVYFGDNKLDSDPKQTNSKREAEEKVTNLSSFSGDVTVDVPGTFSGDMTLPDKLVVAESVQPNMSGQHDVSTPEDKDDIAISCAKLEKNVMDDLNDSDIETLGDTETKTLSGAETQTLSDAETKTLCGAETQTLSGADTKTLSGADTQTLCGAETKTLSGAETQTLSGADIETLGGAETKTLSGAETQTLSGADTKTLSGAETQTLSGAETKTLSGAETKTLSGAETQTLGGADTKTLGGTETKILGGADTETLGGADTKTLSGAETKTLGGTETKILGGAETKILGGADTETLGGADTETLGGTETKILGGAETKILGGADTETLGGADTKTLSGADTKTVSGATHVPKWQSVDEVKKHSINFDSSSQSKGKSLFGKKKGLVKKKFSSSAADIPHGISRETTSSETTCNTSDELAIVVVDRACQVNMEELKNSTKTAPFVDNTKSGTRRRDNQRGKHKQTTESCRQYHRYYTPSTKPAVCDQGTSTSEPVIEDDHIQILTISSDSLVTVTLHMVGITDLVISDCPVLSKLSVNACRVLKHVKLISASRLQKMTVTQCKKFDDFYLLQEVCNHVIQRNKVIFLRPLHQFDRISFEKCLLSKSSINYNICIIYDYSCNPSETLYNRQRITHWSDLFTGINGELLSFYNFPEWSIHKQIDKYPWGRQIYTMSGYNADRSRWELVTDIPWLRPLYECSNLSEQNITEQEKQVGVYCPAAKGHFGVSECLEDLQDFIAEKKSENLQLLAFSLIIYINMCDMSGTPTPDCYI